MNKDQNWNCYLKARVDRQRDFHPIQSLAYRHPLSQTSQNLFLHHLVSLLNTEKVHGSNGRVSTFTLSDDTPPYSWQTTFFAYQSSYLLRMNCLASPLIEMSRGCRWWVMLAGTFCRTLDGPYTLSPIHDSIWYQYHSKLQAFHGNV